MSRAAAAPTAILPGHVLSVKRSWSMAGRPITFPLTSPIHIVFRNLPIAPSPPWVVLTWSSPTPDATSSREPRECSDEEWEWNHELNLASHWRLAKASRAALAANRQPGCLVIVTSNHAYRTIPGCFPYNVAKTALTGLVRALAIEWGPSNPCRRRGPRLHRHRGKPGMVRFFPDPAAERERTDRMHPVGRIGTPDEVGNLCAFLASPLSRLHHGQYRPDGRRTLGDHAGLSGP
jgi:NAD(P)-dependent dehydrogenase (short-subunit alcohol dehydrogenase family)